MISHAFLKSLACEQQTHFRKCVCCSQAMKSQTPNNFGAVGSFLSKISIDSQLNSKKTVIECNQTRLFFQPTAQLAAATKCGDLLFLLLQDGANKTYKLQKLNRKIDRNVYYSGFKVTSFGTSHVFLPISHYFSQP